MRKKSKCVGPDCVEFKKDTIKVHISDKCPPDLVIKKIKEEMKKRARKIS